MKKVFGIKVSKFVFALSLSILAAYHKLRYFQLSSRSQLIYLIVLLLGLAFILLKKKFFVKLFLASHLVFHGLFLLTLPMGMVFALTGGSYWFPLEIFLIFYLPSLVAFYLIFKLVVDLGGFRNRGAKGLE